MMNITKSFYIILILTYIILAVSKYCFSPTKINTLPKEPKWIPFVFGKEINLQLAEQHFGEIGRKDTLQTTDGHLGQWDFSYSMPKKNQNIIQKEGEIIGFKDGTYLFTLKNKLMMISFSPKDTKSNLKLKIGDSEEKFLKLYGKPNAKYSHYAENKTKPCSWNRYLYKVDIKQDKTTGFLKYSEYAFWFDDRGKLVYASFEYQKDERYTMHLGSPVKLD